jgi:hypothetical protein
VHQVLEVGAVGLERDAEGGRDLLVGRAPAGRLLELLDLRADLARHLTRAPRHDVAAAELVEHRAADPLLGEREERLVAARVVALGGLGQAEHAGGDQILARDPVRAAPGHPHRDPAGDLDVRRDQAIALRGGALHLHGVSLHRDSPCARAVRHHDDEVEGASDDRTRVSWRIARAAGASGAWIMSGMPYCADSVTCGSAGIEGRAVISRSRKRETSAPSRAVSSLACARDVTRLGST